MKSQLSEILKMLEEGKITASQAQAMIEGLNDKQDLYKQNQDSKTPRDPINKTLEEFMIKSSSVTKEINESLNKIHESMEKNLQFDTKKYNEIFKDLEVNLEGKINKIAGDLNKNTEILDTKIAEKVPHIKKAFEDTREFNDIADSLKTSFGNISSNVPEFDDSLIKMINNFNNINNEERALVSVISKKTDNLPLLSLSFENMYGNIFLDGYDEDIIKIRIYCSPKENKMDKLLDIVDRPNFYSIKIKKRNNTNVNFKIEIPREKFNKVKLITSKGKINASYLQCKELSCISNSGKISIAGTEFDSGEAFTSSNKIEFCDITCNKLYVKASKSPVIIENLNCSNCEIITSSERIDISLSDEWKDYLELKLKNSNGTIEADLAFQDGTAVFIEASTKNHNIIIDIPNFIYSNDYLSSDERHRQITGKNSCYDSSARKIDVSACTENAAIEIR
ncbi:hypothetical protein OXPF_10450 [Oxobacter pfennigii]|uniref:Uncharacterized protein n=1 Tax=Oxobacter pfennigii TaxID=36849 RepID=A0A0P8W9N4_9CLOT|nr:DUF4097 family beta strand repeat-containing protein [Oxobacter pfennigii]KPU45350.1 hypothetical protein OXPF_10450 [Oxobacter pfennigii]